MTHICIRKLTIIGSDNGLSPGRCQAIIWTNAGILLIGRMGTKSNEILINVYSFIQENVFENVVGKVMAILFRPQCVTRQALWYQLWVFCKWYPYQNGAALKQNDVITMRVMASQITRLTIVYSTFYSGADERKHQSSMSLAFVTGEFPAQKASHTENVFIWWHHHVQCWKYWILIQYLVGSNPCWKYYKIVILLPCLPCLAYDHPPSWHRAHWSICHSPDSGRIRGVIRSVKQGFSTLVHEKCDSNLKKVI